MSHRRFYIICTIVALTFLVQKVTGQSSNPNIIRGVCWVAGDSIISRNLDPLVNNHVNWISQTPFGWQGEHNDPNLQYSGDGHWGESDFGLIHSANLAHDRGIKVILKPHIWMHSSSGKWRSDIEMNSPEDWDTWFSNYTNFMMHYAKVAEKGKMEALCIGTELLIPTTQFPERWIELIQKIKTIYSGKLTYAANFYKEYEAITFWGELDAIGIQGYFPLAQEKNPTKEAICKAWEPHIANMERISLKYGKPIIFTEVGYKNSADAAIEPWVWPHRLEEGFVQSEETQAICLDAMFESLWNKSWFDGVFIWKWFHSSYKYSPEEYQLYRAERIKRAKARGRDMKAAQITFSPQDKKGEQVMREWFGKN